MAAKPSRYIQKLDPPPPPPNGDISQSQIASASSCPLTQVPLAPTWPSTGGSGVLSVKPPVTSTTEPRPSWWYVTAQGIRHHYLARRGFSYRARMRGASAMEPIPSKASTIPTAVAAIPAGAATSTAATPDPTRIIPMPTACVRSAGVAACWLARNDRTFQTTPSAIAATPPRTMAVPANIIAATAGGLGLGLSAGAARHLSSPMIALDRSPMILEVPTAPASRWAVADQSLWRAPELVR